MTSSLIAGADLDGSGHGRPGLAIRGKIGSATASWFRDRLDEAHLVAGDVVLLSSPGGDLDQAIIMGEIIDRAGSRPPSASRTLPASIKPSYCASACVLVYAGGKTRYGIEGSALGVHRFVTSSPGRDPVAETQRTAGMVLSYMTKMGVSSSVVEAMSETSDVRWLGPREASAMNLITDPIGRPLSRPPPVNLNHSPHRKLRRATAAKKRPRRDSLVPPLAISAMQGRGMLIRTPQETTP